MSASFADQLRSRSETIRIAGEGPRVTLRVQYLEGWDAVRLEAPASSSVLSIKAAALAALAAGGQPAEDFVMKHRGVEILDERMVLAAAGVPDHAILSVSHRRRRAVR